MSQQEVNAPTQDIYLSVQEVYGASLSPIMHPRHPHVVVFATGPFIVIWDWKADRKQVCCAIEIFEFFTSVNDRKI